MRGFVLKTPGKRAATPGRTRGAKAPVAEYDCPPTPRQARDAAAEQEFAQRGVRTVLAIKPLEAESGVTRAEYPILTFDPSARALVTTAPPEAVPGDITPEHSFDSRYFDHVYQGPTLRVDLKKELQPFVDCVVGGRSAAVVAYGQTGSGKTFLMEGEPSAKDRAAWGLVPHAIYKVLQAVQRSSGKKFLVSLSYLEVYNEIVRDLLAPAAPRKGEPGPSLQLKLNADGYYDVPDATVTPVSDVTQALALLRTGAARRACGATHMNARSSRSFADVILTVESIEGGGGVCCGRLHLVDLAGSERQAQTGAQGGRLKESSSINLALLALRKVVHARSAAQPTLAPYTDSKVTKILKDALSGDAALLVVCCLSASPVNYQDSLGTLKFAASCRSLTAKPTVRRVRTVDSRITGLSVAVERVRAAEQAAAAERMIRLESRAVAQELELQVAEARLCEARGQLAAGANLALAARAACEELLLHCAAAVDELVAGQGAASEAAAGLLARHVLPQLDFCLGSPQMTAHVAPSALLRFCKSLLQVNFAAAHSAAAPLASLFDRLIPPKLTSPLPRRPMTTSPSSRRAKENPLSPQSADFGPLTEGSGRGVLGGCEGLLARTWPGLLTYCAKLVLAEASGDPPLPPFVLGNMEKALRGIGRVLADEEVKRVSGPGENGSEAREALEVSEQVLAALSGAENRALGARFSNIFRAIIRDGTQIRRQPLLDLGSPVGLGKPSSPGSWLTPSRAWVRAEPPRGKGSPVLKAALSGGGHLLVREMSIRSGGTSPESASETEPTAVNGANPTREPGEGKVLTSAGTQGLRPVKTAQGTPDWVANDRGHAGRAGARGTALEVESDILLGGDADGSPGSWLTPGCKKTGAFARSSRLRAGEERSCSEEDAHTRSQGGKTRVAEEWSNGGNVAKAKGEAPDKEMVSDCKVAFKTRKKANNAEGGQAENQASAEPESASAQETSNEKHVTEAKKTEETSGKGGARSGGKSYPRALIAGEWHTPEYMKPKGTVARYAKTCERASVGLRTPDDAAAASKAMASVKKVLFAEVGDRTRGSRPLEARRSSDSGGVSGPDPDRRKQCESVGIPVPSTDKSGGSPILRAPGSVEKRRLATVLVGEVEPRKVLSPLKQSGAWPTVARKASPFGAQYLGKENAPANLQPTAPLPPTSALKPGALTSPRPSLLKQALLRSPSTSGRAFGPLGPLPTSAARPPRVALIKEDAQRVGSAAVHVSTPYERNGGAGGRNESGIAFAQLRGQLQSLLASGEKRRPEMQSNEIVNSAGAQSAKTESSRMESKTPLVTRTERATSFLSPALLWTPSQGPSPSLANLRERLAGMARQ
ncbi:Kinesin-like protein [Klebsormidium nitens]|uniref:Kinesin-like protein n=1 Tax=Klebsormidium nitens TaxID=105231 RepID=A0A1Y1HP89_KLENI|nr:Kinesin-like protein [Klebsormidium nitens]|eukprot:GAQ78791.1 Kinesin-like protein [Klebsormidium nitens]